MKNSNYILPIIVISQFCCTSLWFAGNAVINDLILNFKLTNTALGNLTSAVQLGFILGTLIFAFFTISDRYSPSKVFFSCAMLASAANMFTFFEGNSLNSLFLIRFITGFFLAGIYPVGMKIASDYVENGLGKSLGFLVGALVLGTALPHFLKEYSTSIPWRWVIIITSMLAFFGGLLMILFVSDGPYRKKSKQLNFKIFYSIFFTNTTFRKASFGYFGHMWELYTFWTFVPTILLTYRSLHHSANVNISFLSFIIIGIGSVACFFSGYVAQYFGTKKMATVFLSLSLCCCLLSPFIFVINSLPLALLFLLFWGMVVIADSPLFSTLVAQHVDAHEKGTALTIVNCIGFSITIISIQLLNLLNNLISPTLIYLFLAIGPLIGLFFLIDKKVKN